MAAESYRVSIEGFRSATFDAIEGLSGAIEAVEYQDGDDLVLRKRPGRVRFGDLTLLRGQLDTADFYRWWYAASEGKFVQRRVQIEFLDARHRALLGWRMAAWPLSWTLSARREKGQLVALETFTLAVERAEFIN